MSDAIGEWDVLFGRGGKSNTHCGNRRFRALLVAAQPEYLAARKTEKARIAARIVRTIQAKGGRFLMRDPSFAGGTGGDEPHWVEVGAARAAAKASQGLREGLDVRRKTVRPDKAFKHTADDTDSVRRSRVAGRVVPAPAAAATATTSGTEKRAAVSPKKKTKATSSRPKNRAAGPPPKTVTFPRTERHRSLLPMPEMFMSVGVEDRRGGLPTPEAGSSRGGAVARGVSPDHTPVGSPVVVGREDAVQHYPGGWDGAGATAVAATAVDRLDFCLPELTDESDAFIVGLDLLSPRLGCDLQHVFD